MAKVRTGRLPLRGASISGVRRTAIEGSDWSSSMRYRRRSPVRFPSSSRSCCQRSASLFNKIHSDQRVRPQHAQANVSYGRWVSTTIEVPVLIGLYMSHVSKTYRRLSWMWAMIAAVHSVFSCSVCSTRNQRVPPFDTTMPFSKPVLPMVESCPTHNVAYSVS